MYRRPSPHGAPLVSDPSMPAASPEPPGNKGRLPAGMAPPPASSISDHFLRLLESTEMSDVTFQVGHREFAAHSVVLAARSPVFRAMFSGDGGRPPARAHRDDGAGKRLVVRIDDTAPAAFGALLHFVYADALPPTVDAGADGGLVADMRVAGELLAAADKYGVERMRLLCERALREAVVDAGTAAAGLVLADRLRCSELKDFCVEYLASSPESLKAMLRTDGYADLKASRPGVLLEVFEKAATA